MIGRGAIFRVVLAVFTCKLATLMVVITRCFDDFISRGRLNSVCQEIMFIYDNYYWCFFIAGLVVPSA